RQRDQVHGHEVTFALGLLDDEHAVEELQTLVVAEHAAVDGAFVLDSRPPLRRHRHRAWHEAKAKHGCARGQCIRLDTVSATDSQRDAGIRPTRSNPAPPDVTGLSTTASACPG